MAFRSIALCSLPGPLSVLVIAGVLSSACALESSESAHVSEAAALTSGEQPADEQTAGMVEAAGASLNDGGTDASIDDNDGDSDSDSDGDGDGDSDGASDTTIVASDANAEADAAATRRAALEANYASANAAAEAACRELLDLLDQSDALHARSHDMLVTTLAVFTDTRGHAPRQQRTRKVDQWAEERGTIDAREPFARAACALATARAEAARRALDADAASATATDSSVPRRRAEPPAYAAAAVRGDRTIERAPTF